MPFTQVNRLLRLDTPLGDDVLLLKGFTGQESISQLFKFDLDLLTEGDPIDFNSIIGERITIRVELIDDKERFFNGFVNRFTQTGSETGLFHYRAEMVPWLWFLTQTADCRIFQNKSIPDIIEQIFKDLGFTDYKLNLQGLDESTEFCVQYRETDFNFVSRLMEQYGIFYFFEHEENKHTLVLANSASVHDSVPNQAKVNWEPRGSGLQEKDVITNLEFEKEIRPGKFAHTDYNFKTPSTNLAAEEPSVISIGGNDKFEIYDFPGEYPKKATGTTLAKIRMQEEEAQHYIINGSSTCRAFTSGYKFDLVDYKPDDLNTAYLLTDIQHIGSMGDTYSPGGDTGGEESYSNTFTCIPHSVPFRPQQVTPKPVVQGPQTAIVVGPSGEEIFSDEFGRVKIQFHWDREGENDENSSCWVRVSQLWAGKEWGAIFIPRIGQEVIVEFLEGDPDRPIITGRVYNAEHMPPYTLPDNQTQSGIKTRSTKEGGTDNFNEIRFEDKKGEEQLFIHAEKNQDIEVENDETHTVGHDRKKDIKNDETVSVGNNRSESVKKDETIAIGNNRSESVEKNETISIGENRDTSIGKNESISIKENRTETVGKDESITISGKRTESVEKDEEVSIMGKRTHNIDKNDMIQVGKKFALVAGDEILLKTGDASITMKKDGTIQIKGKDITIKGSGKINVNASGDLIMKGSKITQN